MNNTDLHDQTHEKRKYSLKYGKEEISFSLIEENVLCEIAAQPVQDELTETEEIIRSLRHPIGTPRISEIVHPGEKICIITSDITRPCPTHLMLPPLMEELIAAGISFSDITLIFALGIHRKHTPDEMKKMVGDGMFDLIHVQDSDPEDTVWLGTTSYGTPVHITKCVAEADRRICLGNIEMHYFAGYSGGAKAIMPGVSNRAAIQANHSRMVEPSSIAGELDANCVRLDIEEAADFCGIDFILNVILDDNKRVVKSVAGDHRAAHRVGCAYLDRMYKIPISKRADIVITSPEGFPKDLNVYQAQKALDNAQHAVKDGGIIILLAHCGEGFGEAVFEKWLLEAQNPKDLILRIQTQFELGGHKAAAIAMVLEKCEVYFVSDLAYEKAKATLMKPYQTIDQAITKAMDQCGADAKIILMPQAGSTLPIFSTRN
jgi:lactate racemase